MQDHPYSGQNMQVQLYQGNSESQASSSSPQSLAEFVRILYKQIQLSDEQLMAGNISDEITNAITSKNYSQNDLMNLAQALHSDNTVLQYVGVFGIRKILSEPNSVQQATQKIIDMNLVPKLIELLSFGNQPKLQFEAAWALTNIMSGTYEHTKVACQNGAVTLFSHLLLSPHKEIQEQVKHSFSQALWALGNLAGDCDELRQLVMNTGAVQIISSLIEQAIETQAQSLIRNGAWTLTNIIRTKPTPQFSKLQPAVPVILKIMSLTTQAETLGQCVWAVNYLTDSDGVDISHFFEDHVMASIKKCLQHSALSIIVGSIRSVGHMACASDNLISKLIYHGIHNELANRLEHHNDSVRKEASWALSNITATGPNILNLILQSDVIDKLIHLAHVQGNSSVKKEVIWALANFNHGAELEQMLHLLSKGVLDIFLKGLKDQLSNSILVCLESIQRILNKSKQSTHHETIKEKIQTLGALETLEALQLHQNEKIYEKAIQCINYFIEGNEVEQVEQQFKEMNI